MLSNLFKPYLSIPLINFQVRTFLCSRIFVSCDITPEKRRRETQPQHLPFQANLLDHGQIGARTHFLDRVVIGHQLLQRLQPTGAIQVLQTAPTHVQVNKRRHIATQISQGRHNTALQRERSQIRYEKRNSLQTGQVGDYFQFDLGHHVQLTGSGCLTLWGEWKSIILQRNQIPREVNTYQQVFDGRFRWDHNRIVSGRCRNERSLERDVWNHRTDTVP